MYGWLYIIKNGDLCKIGITKDIDKRMSQLKPDYIISKIYSNDFKELEKEFHMTFKSERIPQTEYFRLDHMQIREIKQRIRNLSYPRGITLSIFVNSTFLLLILFIVIFLFISLTINDMNTVFIKSLFWMDKITFGASLISLFFKSRKYYSFLNELRFRLTRFLIYLLCAYFFRFLISVLYV